MYFLATPHRGSDFAKLLHNLLSFTCSSREYVADLKRGSAALRSINDEFRKCCSGISLWSLYETQKLKLGLLNTIIVDPDSATLGYPDERQVPMFADHRSICKFDSPSDSNYVTLRNCLAATVQDISSNGTEAIAVLPLC